MRHLFTQLRSRPPQSAPRRSRRGFTLIEAAMTTAIIGFGVVGMVQLLAAGTVSNAEGTELTTAVNLANNIREISLGMSYQDPQQPTVWNTKEAGGVTAYDNVFDLDGDTYSPPLDVRRYPISNYTNWAQQVVVDTVDPDQLASARPKNATWPTARVAVTITRNGTPVHTASWLVVAPNN